MSETRENGGPAFPNLKVGSCGPRTAGEAGMSLRDWFAGQALAGMLGHPDVVGSPLAADFVASFADDAYAIADAMLVARQKEGQP